MRHARFILSSLGLFLGFTILAVSLSAGNSQVLSSSSEVSTNKEFYLGQTILPDHVAYPVLMAVDRAKLEMASDSERVYTEIEYARRRFEYAQALLDKGDVPLALTTLTKAEKYLIQAAHTAFELPNGDNQRLYALKSLYYYDQKLEEVKPAFTDADRAQIDQLQQEIQALQLQLDSQLPAELTQ